ncbi:MAG: hypothetical protein M3401_02160, partial [Actinomycetota bacterium]|nr:hypothetical protein [Actinomycetota bacterium]
MISVWLTARRLRAGLRLRRLLGGLLRLLGLLGLLRLLGLLGLLGLLRLLRLWLAGLRRRRLLLLRVLAIVDDEAPAAVRARLPLLAQIL